MMMVMMMKEDKKKIARELRLFSLGMLTSLSPCPTIQVKYISMMMTDYG